MASAGLSPIAAEPSPLAAAATSPVPARWPGRMRLPVAAKANSNRADKTIGSALRSGLALRNETIGASELEAGVAIVLSRAASFTLRRSENTARKSAAPSITIVSRAASRVGSNNSALSETKCVEEVPFEPEKCRARDEIGTHPRRFEAAMNAAVDPFASILKTEQLPGGDDVAFHPRDFGNALYAANAVPHAFDVHD